MSIEIAEWIASKLLSLPEQEFVTRKHRAAPEICKRHLNLRYFSVPLSSGTGSAVLAQPRGPAGSEMQALVILLHGLGDDATFPHWHWIHLLSQYGLSVLSFDWDGHGYGGASTLDFQAASRSLPLLLDKLYGSGDAPAGVPCYLMGHSAGANFVLLSATRDDVAEVVDAVIAVSPSLVLGSHAALKQEVLSYASPFTWMNDLGPRLRYYGWSGLFPAAQGFKREDFPIRTYVGIDYVDQLRCFVAETFEARRVLQNVRIPTLWLHGTRDSIAPYDKVLPLMREIPSGLFMYADHDRGHLRMAYSEKVPLFAARFIDRFYRLSRKRKLEAAHRDLARKENR